MGSQLLDGDLTPSTPRLTIELVPSTCWYANVRTNVSAADWNRCKAFVRERSGDRCEICGGSGRKWAVECHEVWDYDDVQHVQRLVGLIALCPMCHKVKHIGRVTVAESMESLMRCFAHLATVNGWPDPMVSSDYVDQAFRVWAERSRHEWTLDISYLTEVLGP